MNLTDDQCQAVSCADGPLAVYAGPGSGKTTVISCRAAYLHRVAGIPAARIVIFTFTRKSALELSARLAHLDTSLSVAAAGTFHAIFLKWLMRYGGENPRIWSEREGRLAMISVLRSLRLSTDDDTLADWLRRLSVARASAAKPGQMDDRLVWDGRRDSGPFMDVAARYEAKKREAGAWDFDDILWAFRRRLQTDESFSRAVRASAVRVMVDEFQDTSPAEWAAIEELVSPGGQIAVVGDDDQSIYGFRGAQPEILRRFLDVWPHAGQVVLRRNFRSTDPIVQLSARLIAHSRERKEKTVAGVSGDGVRPTLRVFRDEWREGRAVAASALQAANAGATVGVLARTHRQLAGVAENLWHLGADYAATGWNSTVYDGPHAQAVVRQLRSASSGNAAETAAAFADFARWRGVFPAMRSRDAVMAPDLEALERLLRKNGQTVLLELVLEFKSKQRELAHLSPRDAVAAVRAVYEPYLRRHTRHPGAAADAREGLRDLARLEERARRENSLSRWLENAHAFVSRREHSGQARIQLLTFHGAKGLEFDRVHVVGLHGLAAPHERALRGLEAKDRAAAVEEERRLLYVAVTRARNELFLSAPSTFAQQPVPLSPFLAEVGLGCPSSPSLKGGSAHAGGIHRAPGTRSELPDIGDSLVHAVFGGGRVQSLETLRDNNHKIGVLFNGQDIRYFAWEAAVRLGHLSRHPIRKGGPTFERNDL